MEICFGLRGLLIIPLNLITEAKIRKYLQTQATVDIKQQLSSSISVPNEYLYLFERISSTSR
jgi:hypothetical protein